MINYRYYHGGDEEYIVELWNKSLPRDPITMKRFRNLVLLDVNFDPKGLRLAFNGDQLVGCVYAVRRLLPMFGTDLERDRGWITFFFVEKGFRKLGIGTKSLEEAITFLHKHGRHQVYFASYAPNYIVPGIDQQAYPEAYRFLKKHQFQTLYSPVAMSRELLDFQISKDVTDLIYERKSTGYSFIFAKEKYLYELIQFAHTKFNPDWGRAIREGILRGMPLNRILIARNKEKLVGFCMYGSYEGTIERFGPFGVDPDERGKGLGKILLNLCLQQMKAEGLHVAWFLWTGNQTPAGYLYQNTGFKSDRKFEIMNKEI